jgi:hypothetical protein
MLLLQQNVADELLLVRYHSMSSSTRVHVSPRNYSFWEVGWKAMGYVRSTNQCYIPANKFVYYIIKEAPQVIILITNQERRRQNNHSFILTSKNQPNTKDNRHSSHDRSPSLLHSKHMTINRLNHLMLCYCHSSQVAEYKKSRSFNLHINSFRDGRVKEENCFLGVILITLAC